MKPSLVARRVYTSKFNLGLLFSSAKGISFLDEGLDLHLNKELHTYIIGHYNPSVRIIDLVSHTI